MKFTEEERYGGKGGGITKEEPLPRLLEEETLEWLQICAKLSENSWSADGRLGDGGQSYQV